MDYITIRYITGNLKEYIDITQQSSMTKLDIH